VLTGGRVVEALTGGRAVEVLAGGGVVEALGGGAAVGRFVVETVLEICIRKNDHTFCRLATQLSGDWADFDRMCKERSILPKNTDYIRRAIYIPSKSGQFMP
jgi:hypothetical protein